MFSFYILPLKSYCLKSAKPKISFRIYKICCCGRMDLSVMEDKMLPVGHCCLSYFCYWEIFKVTHSVHPSLTLKHLAVVEQ